MSLPRPMNDEEAAAAARFDAKMRRRQEQPTSCEGCVDLQAQVERLTRLLAEQVVGWKRTCKVLRGERDEAKRKLDAVVELPLHHDKKVAGFVEEGEHPCYDHCLACRRDAILGGSDE